MMDIKTMVCNLLQENCYVVSDETGEAVVIDCGAYGQAEMKAVVHYLKDNGLRPVQVLLTHGHFDHIFGLQALYDEWGLKPRLHPADNPNYEHAAEMAERLVGMAFSFRLPPLGEPLSDGENISFGSHAIRVVHTPGHTAGGVVFYVESEKTLFAGDTLFRQSVGRTDLPDSSWQQLADSVQRLSALPDNVTVMPGHGPMTTIGYEKRQNPYMNNLFRLS